MQIGSLVTPKRDINNFWYVGTVKTPFYRPLKKGEILTISLIDKGPDESGEILTGLAFEETGIKIHPNINKPVCWWDELFDELQPPMDIADELFSHEPEKCEA